MKTLGVLTSFVLSVVFISEAGFAGQANVMPLRVPPACRQIVHSCKIANTKNGIKKKMDFFADCIDPVTSGKTLKNVKPPTAKMLKSCKAAVVRKRNAVAHKKS